VNVSAIHFREKLIRIPMSNPGFQLAAKANLFRGRKQPNEDGTSTTPVGYIRFDDGQKPVIEIALIPGEMYPELSVGGPASNLRTASHLRLLVPGVRFLEREHGAAIVTGEHVHESNGSADEPTYAVLVKTFGSPPAAPVFLVCGMTAASNRAAAHHLAVNHRDLARRYGTGGRFALLLSLRGLYDYGADAIVDVDDITPVAFSAPATPPA
jgi:hypothetical protein